MFLGVRIVELRPRDVAERMFRGRGVRFERGGAFRRGRLPGKELRRERGRHVAVNQKLTS